MLFGGILVKSCFGTAMHSVLVHISVIFSQYILYALHVPGCTVYSNYCTKARFFTSNLKRRSRKTEIEVALVPKLLHL